MLQVLEHGYPERSFMVPAYTALPPNVWSTLADDQAAKGQSHLCTHADAAGTYVPVDALKQPLLAFRQCPWRPIPGTPASVQITGCSAIKVDHMSETWCVTSIHGVALNSRGCNLVQPVQWHPRALDPSLTRICYNYAV